MKILIGNRAGYKHTNLEFISWRNKALNFLATQWKPNGHNIDNEIIARLYTILSNVNSYNELTIVLNYTNNLVLDMKGNKENV